MSIVEFFFRLGGILVGLSVAVSGISVMISSRTLALMCGRNCAVAGLLSFFGEPIDKILYGSLFIGFGTYLIFTVVRPRREKRKLPESDF